MRSMLDLNRFCLFNKNTVSTLSVDMWPEMILVAFLYNLKITLVGLSGVAGACFE